MSLSDEERQAIVSMRYFPLVEQLVEKIVTLITNKP